MTALRGDADRLRKEYEQAKSAAEQNAELRMLQRHPQGKAVRDTGIQVGPARASDAFQFNVEDLIDKAEEENNVRSCPPCSSTVRCAPPPSSCRMPRLHVLQEASVADSDSDEAEVEELPQSVVTPIQTIRFDKKGVKPMKPVMCRKLIAAMYQVTSWRPGRIGLMGRVGRRFLNELIPVNHLEQVKLEFNAVDDAEGRQRQELAEFVPDQMLVLYGVKKIASKHVSASQLLLCLIATIRLLVSCSTA